MEQDVSIPGGLRDGDVQRVGFDPVERDDQRAADAVPSRPEVPTEELLRAGVDREPAMRLVAAGERLPAPADCVEPAWRVDEVKRLCLCADAGEGANRVAARHGKNAESVTNDRPRPQR